MFDAILSKFEKPLSMVIAIDDEEQQVHFYLMNEEDKSTIKHDIELYKANLFTDEFYEKFDEVLKSYREKNPDVSMQKVALIIPDRVILFDAINVPVIKKQAMSNSLTTLINSLYKNNEQIKFNNILLGQNKQYATYSIVGIRKEILVKLKKICDDNQVGVSAITFETNAIVNGATNFNPDLKSESSIILDIRTNNARLGFISKGKMVGYYPLPFGSSMLYKSRLAAEDLLFDHSSGELLVLNAKERAKSRALTTMEQMTALDSDEENNNDNVNPNPEQEGETFSFDKKTGLKKTARKLPKSMQREVPKTREEYVYENFRIFMKWAQDLIIFNPVISAYGRPEKIYVNMPREFDYLYEMANNDTSGLDNPIQYIKMIADEVYDEGIAENLSLFGGFYSRIYNKTNCF